MRRLKFVFGLFAISLFCSVASAQNFPLQAKRILFLGDSITHSGHYITLIEAHLRASEIDHVPELINLGLPSETCNGKSEPEHPFPRPNVHERIERALSKLKPDVVVSCYGMNDGIYYPPNEENLAAYKNGIDGIITKVKASGAKLILMTPPAFDPLPMKKKGKLLPAGEKEYSWKAIYENYDDTLVQFTEHVKSRRDDVDMVVDLHTAVTSYVSLKRKTDSDFTMSGDGVHVNNEGHEVLAAAIMKAWGLDATNKPPQELVSLLSKRQSLMHNAWLSHVGHKRPGVKAGLPIEEANKKAAELEQEIASLLQPVAR